MNPRTRHRPVHIGSCLVLAFAFVPDASAAQVVDSTQVVADSVQTPDSLEADLAGFDSLDADAIQGPVLSPEVVAHLRAMTDSAIDTPYGMGYVPTGLVEARIAEAYVRIAGQDSSNVRAMQENMTHVLHAIDPGLVARGAGLGYGFRRAAQAVGSTISLAAGDPTASPTLLYHSSFVEEAAAGALARAEDAIALARRIQTSDDTDPEAVLSRLEDLGDLLRAMAYGFDRDRDGRIGNDASEAGLAGAAYHLELVRRVEQLPPPRPLPDGLPIPEVPRDPGDTGR